MRLLDVALDVGGELIAAQHVAHFVGGQAGVDGECRQLCVIGDVLAVDEIRLEQSLLHRVALTLGRGVVRESVCVEGVGDDGAVVVERQSDLLRSGDDVGDGLAGDVQGPAFLLGEVLHGVAGGVGLRVGLQLEAPPDDFDLVAVRQLRQRASRTCACRCSRTDR